MKSYYFTKVFRSLAFALIAVPAVCQIPSNFKMVNARVDEKGTLVITASKSSSKDDFNFLAGDWQMDNRRLKCRLNNCTEWIEYKSSSHNYGQILQGIGNMDTYRTHFNPHGDDKPYEGFTLRLFNPKTKLWSLYWVDSNLGVLDPPVVGSFEGNVGTFYCRDTFQEKSILVMFQWDKTNPDHPVWAQAFSENNGKTWEMNMTNVSHRVTSGAN